MIDEFDLCPNATRQVERWYGMSGRVAVLLFKQHSC